MLPSSPLPEPVSPKSPSPRKRLPGQHLVASVLATALLVAAFAGVFAFVVRGAGNTPNRLRAASGPFATSTAEVTVTGTAISGSAPSPTATTASGGGPGQQTGQVRVTKNQDMRPACVDDTAPYTVTLLNVGTVTASWHVYIPAVVEPAFIGPATGPQPLSSPLASYPYWADVKPQDGSVAPGQTASFVMTPRWAMPCGGTTYHGAVQLSFPSGITQPDIPLTYAGTGPARYSKVVLVSGSLTMTQPCPASGAAPAPFTFAFKNTGNYKAYPSIDTGKDDIGLHHWADIQSVTSDSPSADLHWLYPGETWTVVIAPSSLVSCDGPIYHTYVYISNAQGTQETITITDTFHS